jgi:hypothetical protein
MTGFIEQFGDIPDLRIDRTKKHKLIDILFITIAAVICSCDEWEEIESMEKKRKSGCANIYSCLMVSPLTTRLTVLFQLLIQK